MDWNIFILLVVVAAAVCGFAFLARTLLQNWKAGSRGREEADASQSQRSRDFERCYNDCMTKANWDPDRGGACEAICRSPV